MKTIMERVIKDEVLTKEELMSLWEVELAELLKASEKVSRHFKGDSFEMCTIVNGKSGKCSEDCSYCAQSVHYKTKVTSYPLRDKEDLLADALRNQEQGIERYSVVTSGKKATNDEVDKLCDIFDFLGKNTSLKFCSSNGLLNEDALKRLKAAGVERYHNNLETSERYFKEICSTHTYEEKIATIIAAKRAGMMVCSGGIIGLGESREDRVDLAITLRNLEIMSIPLNVLSPIPDTPLATIGTLPEDEFLRTCAIFRLANPKAFIRLAGGRSNLEKFGINAFKSGVNGTISGELLTTYGNSTSNDMEMIKNLGFVISG